QLTDARIVLARREARDEATPSGALDEVCHRAAGAVAVHKVRYSLSRKVRVLGKDAARPVCVQHREVARPRGPLATRQGGDVPRLELVLDGAEMRADARGFRGVAVGPRNAQ